MTAPNPLPFGTLDLDPQPHVVAGPPRRIRCFVRGCKQLLRPPALKPKYIGEACPDHGIRCHTSGTYSYVDVRRNIIVAPDLFAARVVGNSFKYESDRLVNEKSEDALTWNVFRTLQESGLLHVVARSITGMEVQTEPYLYLWGLNVSDETSQPWDLLIAARERFESHLPVTRPHTEPDIALYLPGFYLILIEAKFTSSNMFYTDGPRRDARSLTKNELLDIYQDPILQILDVDKARRTEQLYYQLWRNVVFAEWMARAAQPGTLAYVANLTRFGQEHESCTEFHGLMNSGAAARFTRLTWEHLYGLLAEFSCLSQLRRYMETKTAGLVQAFELNAKLHP